MEKLNKMLMGEISKFKAILKENNVFSENDNYMNNIGYNNPRKNTRDSNDEEIQQMNFKKKNNQTVVTAQEEQAQHQRKKSQDPQKSPNRHNLDSAKYFPL